MPPQNITHGMNVDEIRTLATTLMTKSGELVTMITDVTTLLTDVSWVGPDAETYITAWDTDGKVKLQAAADILEGASLAATANADAQETTSDGTTGTFTAATGAAPGPVRYS